MLEIKSNIKLIFGIVIIAIVLSIIASMLQNPPLLTGEKEDVIKIEVNYLRNEAAHNVLLSEDKDKELIIKLYDSVSNTKDIVSFRNPREYERQESDPMFTIKFFYSNDLVDLIYSTETGNYLYRHFNRPGWVGGKNDNILSIIEKLR